MSAQPAIESLPTVMETAEHASAVFPNTPQPSINLYVPNLLQEVVEPVLSPEDMFDTSDILDEFISPDALFDSSVEDEGLRNAFAEAARELEAEFGSEEEARIRPIKPAVVTEKVRPTREAKPANFTDLEQKMLAHMLANSGMEFSSAQLIRIVNGSDAQGLSNLASQFLKKMRFAAHDFPYQERGNGNKFKIWLGEPRPETEPADIGIIAEPSNDAAPDASTRKRELVRTITVISADVTAEQDVPEVAEEESWQDFGLCAQTDPESFFPEKGGSTRISKQICSNCPVIQECLNWALETDERFGIWGGLSERERRRITQLQKANSSEEEINEVLITQYAKVPMKNGPMHMGLKFALARREELAAATERAQREAEAAPIAS
jgi:WhiB family redox-sensing transcriptional regulator